MMTPGLCRRGLRVLERGDSEEQVPEITGYGAVFYQSEDRGTEYQLWDDVYERIMPGAFAHIGDSDVRSFFNHNPDVVLGRTVAGTLTLSVDAVGLRYAVTPPDSAQNVVESVKRGDVDGSSFMFVPTETTWRDEAHEERTITIREINRVELLEVGPVTFPAYEATSARSGDSGPERRFAEWLLQHITHARGEFTQHRELIALNTPEARAQRSAAMRLRLSQPAQPNL